eukprot:14946588-Heterocapsa_arctica.AAC.1
MTGKPYRRQSGTRNQQGDNYVCRQSTCGRQQVLRDKVAEAAADLCEVKGICRKNNENIDPSEH